MSASLRVFVAVLAALVALSTWGRFGAEGSPHMGSHDGHDDSDVHCHLGNKVLSPRECSAQCESSQSHGGHCVHGKCMCHHEAGGA